MKPIEFHPIADIFPLIPNEDLSTLAEDIKQNGLYQPIVLYEGKVLDGRNRYLACSLAGVDPKTEQFSGSSPTAYVISQNLHRRHLSQSQKAVVALDAEKWLAKEAKERQRTGKGADGSGGRGNKKEKIWKCSCGEIYDGWDCKACGYVYMPKGPGDTNLKEQMPEGLSQARDQAGALLGVSGRYVSDAKAIAEKSPELLEEVRAGNKTITRARQEIKRAEAIEHLESISVKEAKALEGLYDVIVIDPPWQMEKIERDERPNQTCFDYPTMSEDELSGLVIPMSDDCHVWLWTTHKFLPMAFRLLSSWGVKYVCTFVWHKPGGFQPFGLPQYNCEFCLYGRHGSPKFIETKAFPTCFEAKRGKHSEKPEEFYEMVKRATAGRRLDMFSRRAINGFDAWGNEA